MSWSTFTAAIHFAISDSDSISSALHSVPETGSAKMKKKRASGLDLLKSRSSHGSPRIDPQILGGPSSTASTSDTVPKEDTYSAQRATLRQAKSIPHLPPLDSGSQSQIRQSRHAWTAGTIQVRLGPRTTSGGELLIYTDEEVEVLHCALKPDLWYCDELQRPHVSMYTRQHVMSLPMVVIQASTEVTTEPKSFMSMLGRRSKGNTISHSVDQAIETKSTESSSSSIRVILLSFETQREMGDWFALFRAFARERQSFRKLNVRFLDLQESSGSESLRTTDGSTTTSVRSARSSDIGSARIKSGWAGTERILGEIYLDEKLVARTTWARAKDVASVPFWGEQFEFRDLPDSGVCTVKLCRSRGNKPHCFATVSIPLISSFDRVKDERYPIKAEGTVIGELRLVVSYQDIPLLREYDVEHFDGSTGTRLVYHLATRRQLDGLTDLLTRLSMTRKDSVDRLISMCEFESMTSGATLFRSNTPLTRALEATMRLACGNFLELSLGPTIMVVLENDVGLRAQDSSVMLLPLVEQLWEDMYAQRGMFPNFLRVIFAKLSQSVKQHHEERKLHYQAISAFLFLRLIGPALMRPHLFGLARGLPTAAVQRTLTLLAKVLHAMAFFTSRDMKQDHELALFSTFIKQNDDSMVDYLASLCTPLDVHVIQSSVQRWLDHGAYKALDVPKMTLVGFVDVRADTAVLLELLYRRRQVPRSLSKDEEVMRLRDLDDILRRTHQHAFDQESDRPMSPRPSLQIDVAAAQSDHSPRVLSQSSWKWGWMSPTSQSGKRGFPSLPSITQTVSRVPSFSALNAKGEGDADKDASSH